MLSSSDVFAILYAGTVPGHNRFTQDSPILPDVWVAYAANDGAELELLLVPFNATTTSALAIAVKSVLMWSHLIIPNESYVLVKVSLPDALRLLSISHWLGGSFGDPIKPSVFAKSFSLVKRFVPSTTRLSTQGIIRKLRHLMEEADVHRGEASAESRIASLIIIAAYIIATARMTKSNELGASFDQAIELLRVSLLPSDLGKKELQEIRLQDAPQLAGSLFSISTNRKATLSLQKSRMTVKADAATRLFGLSSQEILWAIVDSGIDATHPAFATRPIEHGKDNKNFTTSSRVIRTLDFTRLRRIFKGELNEEEMAQIAVSLGLTPAAVSAFVDESRTDLYDGRLIDWAHWTPLLEMRHDATYKAPRVPHGTHVAGILGSNWLPSAYEESKVPADLQGGPIIGMCPDIKILDVRVFDEDATADEFSLISALQYLRWMNQSKNKQVVHGVNLSFSLVHDVRNFACGRTPICDECERLWQSGVVVVASAGNYGFQDVSTNPFATRSSYANVTISDPGNTERVITVGSTHGARPHAYGVSYFSSKGPTGDGRYKPDIVAPGEKIMSTGLNGEALIQDGTSMAAPHVSGVAAMLLSRHKELIGHPDKVKDILCKSATDLGRNRYFQGAGLVDALRALQSL